MVQIVASRSVAPGECINGDIEKKVDVVDEDVAGNTVGGDIGMNVYNEQEGTETDDRGVDQLENEKQMVRVWLTERVGLPAYYAIFIEHGYETMEIIKAISNEYELVEIGIDNEQHRREMMKEIEKL